MVTRVWLVLMAFMVAAPGAARADAREASIDVHPLGGLAVLGDTGAPGRVKTSSLTGGAARMTYATHDVFAYEIEMAVAQSGATVYPDVARNGLMGELERVTELARVQLGVRLRLGARYIPTVNLAVGGQVRAAAPSRFLLADGSVLDGPDAPWTWDFTVCGGVGFDYRINARWVTGVFASAIQAFSVQGFPLDEARFQSIEGGAHVSYVWYPGW